MYIGTSNDDGSDIFGNCPRTCAEAAAGFQSGNNHYQDFRRALYDAVEGDRECNPNTYAVTMVNPADNNATVGTIYEKYATGWYSDANTTTSISTIANNQIPTRDGYVFRGYYSTAQSDLTANGGSGTRHITNAGTISAGNTTFTADGNVYAAWAHVCEVSSHVSSCGLTVKADGTVEYRASCDTYYELRSGTGTTYQPICDPIDWTITYADGQTSVGIEFYNTEDLPYTLATRSKNGYILAGWCDGVQTCDNPIRVLPAGTSGNKTLYAKWVESVFEITTTSDITTQSDVNFAMSASGVFYVDWGDGTVETIDRTNNVNYTRYGHKYNNGTAYTIKFAGSATGYSTASDMAAITFNVAWVDTISGEQTVTQIQHAPLTRYIQSISGSLGAIFPTLHNGAAGLADTPRFVETFKNATNLTALPTNQNGQTTLFAGVTGAAAGMFKETFNYTHITSIPANLFASVSGHANEMFNGTFDHTYITTIPATLFTTVSGSADGMFQATFKGCQLLTEIPESLFSHMSGSATNMFNTTFNGCTSLTSIPAGLFATTSGTPAAGMFNLTFAEDVNITEFVIDKDNSVPYIPTTFFGGLNVTNYTTNANNRSSWVADGTFAQTQIAESCPGDMFVHDTGFNDEYAAKVSCEPCPAGYDANTTPGKTSINQCQIHCDGGYYIATAKSTVCVPVGAGYWTPAANVNYNSTGTRTQCDAGESTAGYGVGADDEYDCGVKLRIGANDFVWLKSHKYATPSLAMSRNGNVYYARMGADGYPMSYGTGDFLKVKYNNMDYFVYDELSAEHTQDVLDNLSNIPSEKDVTGEGYISENGNSANTTGFKLTKNGTWGVSYNGFPTLYGESKCANIGGGANYATETSDKMSTTREGSNCWCKLTSVDDDRVAMDWVYVETNSSVLNYCQTNCAAICAHTLAEDSTPGFKSALLQISNLVAGIQ